ncbi:transglycosylase domain-containing protein [Propioniciclava soli]|uniref:transglycosylase domain-containing protein n=1 Tax=Propioniciclava soli TaxID=2775081 RepID=UPI001E558387|nr:transglycosylase domain-containing protein [Propioniciclava soli]
MGEPSLGRKLYSSLMFLAVSVLGGVLVAGLAVPTAGVASEVSKLGAAALDSIPAEVETPPPAEGSRVLMADGSLLTNFFEEYRVYVPLDEISPTMRQAQISIEDQRFYEHGALDLRGTLRALVRTTSGNTQGGSTLTQQYVKLALIDKAVADNDEDALSAARDRTFARKVLELRYAIALEQKLSKDEILERYLNLSYYGAGAYGVEAAARRYFGTTAKDLTLSQSAMLAGLVRNPATTDPISNEKIALERRNNVLDVMQFQGVISPEDGEAAKAEGFDRALVTETPHGCNAARYQQLCDIVYRTLLQMDSLGPDSDSRKRFLKRGGLTIQTEIDPRTQDAAQAAVSNYIYPTDPVLGVIATIEPGTGLIKAIAQSRPERGEGPGQTYWNYAMEPSLGGAEGYFGGSTFKMFVVAAAIEKGMPTGRTYQVERSQDWSGETFRTCDGTVTAKDWEVNGVGGSFDLYSGTTNSVNNFFVALEQDVGLCDVAKMAEKLGLKLSGNQRFGISDAENTGPGVINIQNPSLTLGTAEVSPISLANAYATIAARGTRCNPIIIQSVTGPDGKTYDVPSADCQQVMAPEVADRITDVMRGPFRSGTARAANIPGYSIAGKTGTDTNAPTIWTLGYTPQLATAAMITVDKRAERFVGRREPSLEGAPIQNGRIRLRGSSGGEAGAHLWKPAMEVALEGYERGEFVAPTRYTPPEIDVPSCSGLGVNACRARLQEAGFGTRISRVESDRPSGTFLGISPRGTAPQWSTITLRVSSGPAPAPAPAPAATSAPPAEPPAAEPAPAQPPGDQPPAAPGGNG